MTGASVSGELRETLTRMLDAVAPGASLTDVRVLGGGVSAQSLRIEVSDAGGRRRTWTVRAGSRVSAREYQLLGELRDRDLGAPVPLYFDGFGALREPHVVLEFIDGAPRYPLVPDADFIRQAAERLALIHRTSPLSLQTPLPAVPDELDDADLPYEPGIDVEELAEGLREARRRRRNPPTFLHGDFWPGNWIWRDGALVGVIDWEDARIGDPLYDLAIARLECLWFFDEAAMTSLTERYVERTGVDVRDLPYWDLRAAARPLGQLSVWSAGWGDLGRPDVTPSHLAYRLQRFVDLARAAR